jgi:ABC-type cobalamin/Fe3+-siderophores transport system ATPase subunit
MIEVKDATIAVGGKTLAEGLSFMAKDGQLTCITGAEGVGKTTLLRTLIGFLPVAQGFVSVDGELLTVDSAQAFRSLMIYLPQEMRLLAHQLNQPSWPESEADEYAVWNQLLPRACQQEQPEPLAPEQIFRLVEKTLSEGRDRRIIIADEPAAFLPTDLTLRMLELLRREAAEGKTVLIASRKPQMIEYANQVIKMRSEECGVWSEE